MRISRLGVADLDEAMFRSLLRLAADLDDDAVLAVLTAELPTLTVLGASSAEALLGFVAFGPDPTRVVLHYLAVAPHAQGRGIGTALVAAVRATHPGKDVVAHTDDDAVGFYRRAGCTIRAADPDPRWPERPRYACVWPAVAS